MASRYSVFMHIPKTAGNCVLATLKGAGSNVLATGHGSVERSVERMAQPLRRAGTTWDNVYKFSFVRNPWDRMVSWYYHSHAADRHDWEPEQHYESFRDWLCYRGVQNLMKTAPVLALTKYDGQVVPNFVGQYEHLERDLAIVAEELRVDAPMIKLSNPGKNRPDWARDFRPFYDTRTDSIIVSTGNWEIAMFRYSRDDEPTPTPVERPLPRPT